jgi:hypothetical protein
VVEEQGPLDDGKADTHDQIADAKEIQLPRRELARRSADSFFVRGRLEGCGQDWFL